MSRPFRTIRSFNCRAPRVGVLCSVLATSAAAAVPALAAEELTSSSTPPAVTELDEIVVTASRISGIKAPTPTTVINADDIVMQGAMNVADVLNQAPSFVSSTTPTSSGLGAGANAGANWLDLRGLGPQRTLILVNGRRHVPSTQGGLVDINLIPQALIERVEVVTGGASAAWGSDAVAGVTNFILDDDVQGFRGSIQAGIAEQGDNRQRGGELAWGSSFADGRGHLTWAAEAFDGDGVHDQQDRAWGRGAWQLIENPDFAPGNGQPMRIIARDVHQGFATEGGLVLFGRFAGTQFGPGGTPTAFNFGRGYPFMIGGDGTHQGRYTSLSVPLERQAFSVIGTYDLTDRVGLTIEGTYGRRRSVNEVLASFSFMPYMIQADNPFIPDSIAGEMFPGEVLPLGRINTDFGFVTADVEHETYRGVLALDGRFGDSGKWSAYYQYGKAPSREYLRNNPIVANLDRAIDAVRDPISGEAVCRSALNASDSGCVPINLFGFGAPSQAALNYVLGDQRVRNTVRQDAAAVDVQGEPFWTWAGAVSVAAGAEYRKESAEVTSDPIAQANGYLIGNTQPLSGSYDVNEVFSEVAVPLLADLPFAKSFKLNGAVRYTDYSTSGSVTTWKVGGTHDVNDWLSLRATRSRDIRAPNIGELFLPSIAGFDPVFDPRDGSQVLVATELTGNQRLRPEEADTFTAGIVIEPRAISGFQASFDYFDIDLHGAIRTLALQDIVNRCFSGNQELCQFVTLDSSDQIVKVTGSYINIASLQTRGFDMEIRYVLPLQNIASSWSGNLRARILGTYIDRFTTSDGITAVDTAGELGPNGTNVPRWRATANLSYDNGAFGMSLTGIYIQGGKYDKEFVEGVDIDDNTVPSYFLLNGSVEFTVMDGAPGKLQLFAVVNNALDRDPPIVPSAFQLGIATNASYYDVIGRSYAAGARFQF